MLLQGLSEDKTKLHSREIRHILLHQPVILQILSRQALQHHTLHNPPPDIQHRLPTQHSHEAEGPGGASRVHS